MHDRKLEEPEEEVNEYEIGSKIALSVFGIVLLLILIVFMLIVLAVSIWFLGIVILGIQSVWGIVFNLAVITLGII